MGKVLASAAMVRNWHCVGRCSLTWVATHSDSGHGIYEPSIERPYNADRLSHPPLWWETHCVGLLSVGGHTHDGPRTEPWLSCHGTVGVHRAVQPLDQTRLEWCSTPNAATPGSAQPTRRDLALHAFLRALSLEDLRQHARLAPAGRSTVLCRRRSGLRWSSSVEPSSNVEPLPTRVPPTRQSGRPPAGGRRTKTTGMVRQVPPPVPQARQPTTWPMSVKICWAVLSDCMHYL